MNRDYQLTAKAVDIVIDQVQGDDLSKFPIERARLRSIWIIVGVSVIAILGYGWTLHFKTVSIVSNLT